MPEKKVLLFKSARIRVDENGLVCLNDIHRAAGFTKSQRPSEWMVLPNTLRSIDALLSRITGKSGNWEKAEYRQVYRTLIGANGGTWVHENLALDFAAYLSPALGIEIRDVFLRYRRGDESLVDDIRSRRPANDDRDLHRQIGKGVRKRYTATLEGHGVTMPIEYARCTNAAYKELFGGTAKQLRQRRGLPEKANIRDNMSLAELAYTMASEALASERIEHQNSQGFLQCHDATRKASSAIRGAIEADRQARLPKSA
jgi:hypothetical protein